MADESAYPGWPNEGDDELPGQARRSEGEDDASTGGDLDPEEGLPGPGDDDLPGGGSESAAVRAMTPT